MELWEHFLQPLEKTLHTSTKMHFNDVGNNTFHGNYVRWYITHFFNFPQCPDTLICSKVFHVGGRLWELRVSPSGQEFENTNGWLGLYLIDMSDRTDGPRQSFRVRLGILGVNGNELCSSVAVKNRKWYKVDKFMHRREFKNLTRKYVENDILRIFCVIEKEPSKNPSNRSSRAASPCFWAEMRKSTEETKNTGIKYSIIKKHDGLDETKKEESEDGKSWKKQHCSTYLPTDAKEPKESESDGDQNYGIENLSTSIPKGIEKLLEDYKQLLICGKASDMTINIGEKAFKAHRCILASRSPVFEAMLEHDMVEKATGVVTAKDMDPAIFQDFLSYLYTGRMDNISSNTALLLFTVADRYQVKELREECLEYMKENLTVENFSDILLVSLQHQEQELTDSATLFFVGNAAEILRSSKWQTFLSENFEVANDLFIKKMEAGRK